MLKLYNTLSRKIEDFTPLNPPKVGMYACGPTVYDYTHIGHLRKYVEDDVLKRVLETNGFEVRQVMNITDVGHLVSDADSGDDKLEKGAHARGETVWEVAKFFEEYFFKSIEQVGIIRPNIIARATDHIGEQIKLIQKLDKNGFIYITDEAIYFDISRFPDYTKLSGQKLEDKKMGAREDVITDSKKRNPQDFALWFFTKGRFENHTMRWSSPWGEGFPGWHIECSAMSMEYLSTEQSRTIDIHTGGIDHIPVHHTNEIAQSEAATGEKFVNYWVHHNFLIVDGEKMSKSLKNFYTIEDIKAKGFDPLALRYLFLTAHYRDKLNFTWVSLEAANRTLSNLREQIRAWDQPKEVDTQFWQSFLESVNNDINMPQAVAVLWEMVHSDISTSSKSATILQMDKVLGLGLDEYLGHQLEIPDEVEKLVSNREHARKNGNFTESDKLRKEIRSLGFEVDDTSEGPKLKKI